ncbi:MAG: glutamine synthetase III [Bacteroidetes bacterium]|nr:glutamine synthetase III [Bacteroidota bacterium]MBL0072524.1 glutamine synthetase III [Bacteroidota bacterium]
MSTLRFKALESALTRVPRTVPAPEGKISDYFGQNVFDKNTMQKFLSKESFKQVLEAVESGQQIERRVAEQVATAMMAWAISKGATHYTHWFQPLTGSTAEKHDSFFELSDGNKPIENFSSSALVQQEPDASSFPNGGIRNTFEARGYTAWDPTSPAFIMESNAGKTLCIPTIFISYTGETLDYKAPLLKALHELDQAAVPVCQYFDKNVTKVNATLGIEQEYFLIDIALFNARPDLETSGRTVFGHIPAKGQQLEDHYFGSIPSRVYAFMVEFEIEAFKLGIPLKTRHNEVAPSQFECAPVFEEINLAVDHNQLLMDVMDKVARRHDFKVLLHEKPYAGINGSGKHNNWSLTTNTGKNLLSPGNSPKTNLQFLTFFINTIKAVHEHADLLRASIASASNDHRLGANEAPPAIMSIFLGSQLSQILDEIEKTVVKEKLSPEEKTQIKINIGRIPEILLDNTDRNRTSPFAFTGNKFEFRAVGSSANSSNAMLVLNTIMANQLKDFSNEVDALIAKNIKKDEAILKVLRKYIVETKNIRFEGNGYGEEWVKEAKKRGLSNITTTPPALDAYVSKKSKELFKKNNIFTERELEARHDILLETYTKKIQIESRVIGTLSLNHIIPAAIRYQSDLIRNVEGIKAIGLKADSFKTQLDLIKEISEHLNVIKASTDAMTDDRRKANKIENVRSKAIAYCDKVRPHFDTIRYHVDKLELLVDDAYWPLPKYREMLAVR